MRVSTGVVAICFGLVWLGACAGDEGPTCGSGTRLKDGKCVLVSAVDACGAGTVQDGSTCLPAPVDSAGTPDAGVDAGADAGGDEDSGADGGADAGKADTGATGDTGDAGETGDAAKPACDPACSPAEQCIDGVCEPLPAPETWVCASGAWADGKSCDCDCGGADPDCADDALPVKGCASGVCDKDGTCKPCVPACSGKQCGDNGCGGSCGACTGKTVCEAGQCVACKPSCDGKDCGDDGCGGTCGTCGLGKTCNVGKCAHPPADASCFGQCGKVTASGCACTGTCKDAGNCCVNDHVCACLPACTGKQCGDDGCGGSCGTCAAGTTCIAGGCAPAVCDDTTCNGHGTCKPSAATCACDERFAAPYCDKCDKGYVDYPKCVTACTADAQCDDNNPCTGDSCEAKAGCLHLPLVATCTDGDACTSGDACKAGTCESGKATDCDDSNACTTDSCDKLMGCRHAPSKAAKCDDGNACTAADACNGVKCAGTKATGCDDGNVCTVDSCDKIAGCVHLPSGATCADNDKCSAGSACQGAACKSLGAKNCDDGNSCTVDSCTASTGACKNAPAADKASCDDGNPCTAGDTCNGKSTCAAGPAICAQTVTKGLLAHYSAAFSGSLDFDQVGAVTTWRDISGKGRHLAAVDHKARPRRTAGLVNGRSGIRLSGAKGLRSKAFAIPTAASVFAVVCTDGNKPLGAIAGHGSSKTDWALAALPGTATAVHVVAAGGNGGVSTKLVSHGCHVLSARISATARDLTRTHISTAAMTGKGATLSKSDQALHIGTDDTSAASGAIVAELLYFGRALTDAERDSVLTYLRTAWGFAAPAADFAWFDATDLSTVVTATNGSGDVLTWKDKSGLGRDATPGKDDAPRWFATGTSNGRPAIRFDGAKVRLQTAAVPTSPHMTVFAVFEMDKPMPRGCLFAQGHDKYFAIRRSEAAKGKLNWHIGANNTAPVVALKTNAWQVLTAVQDATTSTVYVDPGAPATHKQAAIAAGTAALNVGNAAVGGQSMGGFVAEIRAFRTALSAADRRYVEHLLRNKYGL